MDVEKLKEYVKLHPDHTLKQIAAALKVGATTVFRWLARLKITFKKRPHYITKEMRKNVQNIPLN